MSLAPTLRDSVGSVLRSCSPSTSGAPSLLGARLRDGGTPTRRGTQDDTLGPKRPAARFSGWRNSDYIHNGSHPFTRWDRITTCTPWACLHFEVITENRTTGGDRLAVWLGVRSGQSSEGRVSSKGPGGAVRGRGGGLDTDASVPMRTCPGDRAQGASKPGLARKENEGEPSTPAGALTPSAPRSGSLPGGMSTCHPVERGGHSSYLNPLLRQVTQN